MGASVFQSASAFRCCCCLHTRQDQNDLHLKRWFFSNIGIFCKSIADPCSFGGRLKLITCQIRHELSVTIHQISTSWKKTLDGGPIICTYYRFIFLFAFLMFFFHFFAKSTKNFICLFLFNFFLYCYRLFLYFIFIFILNNKLRYFLLFFKVTKEF